MPLTVWKDLEIMEASGGQREQTKGEWISLFCLQSLFVLACFWSIEPFKILGYQSKRSKEKRSRFLQVELISVWLIRYNHCKLIKLTFFVPFTKNGIFKLTKCGLSPKGLCILRSVTRIMVKTYNCSCNRNMYLWWCSNVYKRLQSFIWRYFYCAFLGFCLGIDSNVQPRVGEFGCIWLEWFARGQGIWRQIFEKCQIPTPCPAPPPPHPLRRLNIDRCIIQYVQKVNSTQFQFYPISTS